MFVSHITYSPGIIIQSTLIITQTAGMGGHNIDIFSIEFNMFYIFVLEFLQWKAVLFQPRLC